MSESSSPPFTSRRIKIFQFDSKQNIWPVTMTVDHENYELKIEKDLKSKVVSYFKNLTCQSSFATSSPAEPINHGQNSEGKKLSSRNYTNESLFLTGINNLAPKPVPFDEIQELRSSDFDMKAVKPELVEKLSVANEDSKEQCKFTLGALLFGKQFHLKKYVFLFVELENPSSVHHPLPSSEPGCTIRKDWKRWIDGLVTAQEYGAMSYFKKLDIWFQKQSISFKKEMERGRYTNIPRLIFAGDTNWWRRIRLHFNYLYFEHYHFFKIPGLCEGLQPLAYILLSSSGGREFTEDLFLGSARVFQYSQMCIERVFQCFDKKAILFKSLIESQDLKTYADKLVDIMRNYVEYVKERVEMDMWQQYEPVGGVDVGRAKTAICALLDGIRAQDSKFLIEEKLVSPDYDYKILDYLFSEDNTIWNSNFTKQYQDMDQPLSEYWINSSHNTYLTGDQLTSASSLECYVRALRCGCRCIEIDVWNGTNNKPIVTHGMTLTTSVPLKDVLIAVRENAFVTTSYPLIISVENHCDVRQQRTMAKYFRRIFGNALVTDDLGKITSLPSPNELRNRILIKGRSDAHRLPDGSVVYSVDRGIAPEFSNLIIYLKSMSKDPEEIATEKDNIDVTLVKSLNETSAEIKFRSNPSFYVRYHKDAMTRIYPKGSRVNSSNFCPVQFWNFGSQMVALNWQTGDKPTQWNRGRFRENGNCGYILKPAFMLSEHMEHSHLFYDPTRMNENDFCSGMQLTIEIISGRHLHKQTSGFNNPIVEVEIAGIDADCKKVQTPESCTKVGMKHYWYHSFEFKVRCPELALLQFSVQDLEASSDKLLLGECTIPVKCLRAGFRSVQLNNSFGEPLLSTLLVNVTTSKCDCTNCSISLSNLDITSSSNN